MDNTIFIDQLKNALISFDKEFIPLGVYAILKDSTGKVILMISSAYLNKISQWKCIEIIVSYLNEKIKYSNWLCNISKIITIHTRDSHLRKIALYYELYLKNKELEQPSGKKYSIIEKYFGENYSMVFMNVNRELFFISKYKEDALSNELIDNKSSWTSS